jgi:hypothetical protein
MMNASTNTTTTAGAQARFEQLGLTLPPAPRPVGLYKPCLVVGRQVYVSGHGPLLPDGTLIRGKVGVAHDIDAGKLAARQVGLAILATLPLVVPELGWVYRATLVAIAGLLLWEHSLVRPDDLSRVNQAFFTANAAIGLLLLGAIVADCAV